ncbi:MAG: DNA helicase RecG, partial [Nitrospiraceae bacterium]|nr:DNA helicase RecG [Nitrospiraceae bacterium]
MTTAHDITAPVQYLKGVGPHKAALLARLGIATIQDLLLTMPLRYEDRRSSAKIVSLTHGQTIAVIGKVIAAEVVQPSRRNPRLRIFQVAITDGSGVLRGKWFNQAFLQR